MRTVGVGAKKDLSNDVEALKKEIKSLKSANTRLKNENDSLAQQLAEMRLKNEELLGKIGAAEE